MPALTKTEATLPSDWYYDTAQFELELEKIWYQDWVCVGRLEDIARPGDYFTATIGTQRIIVARADQDGIRAFHNTCRHRGSLLCTATEGHFRNGRIICPYHTWTYSLEGELVATPFRQACDDFSAGEFSLYRVHADTWGGFIFVNLSVSPAQSLAAFLGEEAGNLDHWPLADMVSVRRRQLSLACNWKIFWENYSECYHCPRIHPELCKVVPVYQQAVMGAGNLPDWQPDGEDDGRARIAAGMTTWSADGRSALPPIDGLSEQEREAGASFASFTASMYVVGHPDYVRSVRILPTGPESTQLVVDWLLLPEVSEKYADEIDHMTEFGLLVVEQDGAVCELNQAGLRSMRHDHGVLVPQEHCLHEFHVWVLQRVSAG